MNSATVPIDGPGRRSAQGSHDGSGGAYGCRHSGASRIARTKEDWTNTGVGRLARPSHVFTQPRALREVNIEGASITDSTDSSAFGPP